MTLRGSLAFSLGIAAAAPTYFSHFTPASAQQSDQPRCTCDFADSQWRAYGTKQACAVYMHDGRKTCEVEFAGLSANPNLISRATAGEPSSSWSDSVNPADYVRLLVARNTGALSDPKLFVPVIKSLMRGAYFRGTTYNDTAAIMDKIMVAFFEKYAPQVSEVFAGKAAPFKIEISKAQFEVGRGFVRMIYGEDRVTAVYFSPE